MDNSELAAKLAQEAIELRKNVLEMAYAAGHTGAHIGGAFSMAEILSVLFIGRVLRYDVNNKQNPDRDRFILSKGHAALAYYAVLARAGFYPMDRLKEFEVDYSPFGTHVSRHPELGLEFASGALGHGLSLGVGAAFAGKIDKSEHHVYVLTGDGECNEGSVWEAAMLAGQHKLDNLVWIIDRNGMQCDGYTKDIVSMSGLEEMTKGCGWAVIKADGHSTASLIEAFEESKKEHGRPVVIIADTIKGKGVSFFENNIAWHHGCVDEATYYKALTELGN